MSTEQTGSTGVVLFDGTGVTITVRVAWNVPPAPTMLISIPSAIFDFFHSDGAGMQATLAALIGSTDLQFQLAAKIKTAFSATTASIIGIQVTSPPVELHSKQVTAILQSGETVRVTFGTPSGIPRAPESSEIQKVFTMLSTLKYAQLSNISNLLNMALAESGRSWDFLILDLEQVNCACKP